MEQPDLGVCLRAFCNDFRSFSSSIEKSCKDLRRAVLDKGHTYVEETHFASLVDDLGAQVENVEAEVSSLEASTVDTISVAELLGHCNEMYLQNESAIKQLQAHLEQYGYKPVQLEPLEDSTTAPGQSAKPSPYTSLDSLRTPSWGSNQKSASQEGGQRGPSSNSGRPPLLFSNARTSLNGFREQRTGSEFTSPIRGEESTLELRRDILGRKAERPAPPPSPGSPEVLSLADLGLSASTLEAIKNDSGPADPPPPAPVADRSRPPESAHSAHSEPQPLSSAFETPRPSASRPASQPSTSTSFPPIARPPEVGGEHRDPVPGVSVRPRDKRLPSTTSAGDSLFPLAEPVTNAEYDSVPFFLRAQVPLQELNGAIQRINDSMTDKRFNDHEGGADLITHDDVDRMNLGPRLKAYLLLLVRLDRIVRHHVAGSTVYTLQAGPSG